MTLDQNDLQTVTTAYAAPEANADRIVLNGEETPINARTAIVLREMRALLPDSHALKSTPILIKSRNSFPTAAGLASSAAGYAAMVTALAGLYKLDFEATKIALSRIARQGSGSATRSLLGGVVAWQMGAREDGSDSQAEQIALESHWPTLEAIVCIASDRKKHVSSTSGMGTSLATSALLAYRASALVPTKFARMRQAIASKNHALVFELTMRDSNQFHATCLDTYPPIFYMTDTSRSVVRLVDELNGNAPPRFAYTFDAGPNAVIFCDAKDTGELLEAVLRRFPPSKAELRADADFLHVRGRTTRTRAQVLDGIAHGAGKADAAAEEGALMYVFHTGIGRGARVLEGDEAAARRLV